VAALERALEAKLFHRTAGGYVLTPSGEALLPRAERVEEEILAAQREVQGRGGGLRGAVRLTAPEAFSGAFLPPLLAGVQRRSPEITLELVADNRSLSLSRREADLALRLSRPREPHLSTRRVAEVGTALYASAAYLAARGKPRLPEIAGHDLIG